MKQQIATGKGRISPASFLADLNALTYGGWELEYRFCPGRMWRFDYANPDRMLAIEIEGAIFGRGRHSRGAGMTGDMEKYNSAELRGWTLLRYPSQPSPYISKVTGKPSITVSYTERCVEWQKRILDDVRAFLTGIVDGQRTLEQTCQAKILSERLGTTAEQTHDYLATLEAH